MEYYYKIMGLGSQGLREIFPHISDNEPISHNGYSSEEEAIEALQGANSLKYGRASYKLNTMTDRITIMKFVRLQK